MDYYDEVVEIKSKPKAAQPSDTESAINTSMDVENAMKKEVKVIYLSNSLIGR